MNKDAIRARFKQYRTEIAELEKALERSRVRRQFQAYSYNAQLREAKYRAEQAELGEERALREAQMR